MTQLARDAHIEILAVALYRENQVNGRSRFIKLLPHVVTQAYWRKRAARIVDHMEHVVRESAGDPT